MKKTAIGYVRVSTQDQVDSGVSIDMQINKIKSYCSMKDIDLVEILIEKGVSGSTKLETRPEASKLFNKIKNKEITEVITIKLDRLFRNASDALNMLDFFNSKNVGLHFIEMGGQAIDTRSPTGKVFFNLCASFAELERNMISERTSSALQDIKRRIEDGEEYYSKKSNKLVKKLGNPKNQKGAQHCKKGGSFNKDRAKEFSDKMSYVIESIKTELKNSGKKVTLKSITDELNKKNIRTMSEEYNLKNSSSTWHQTSVYRLIKRAKIDIK